MASPTIVGNVISDVYAISLFSPDPIDIPTAFGIHIDRLRAGTSQLLIANNTIKNIYSSSPSTAISRGIYVDGYATEEVIISDNHISGVVASGGEGAVEGILVLTWSSTHITISNNTISSNAALNTTGYPWGGFLGIGAGAEEGPLTVQNNLIVNNQSSEGSYITTMGMMLGSESTDPSVIAFNTVANNVGGEGEPEPGMYSAGIMVGLADSSSIVKNNIIATNSGYGLSTYGPIQPDYNNVWGNSLGDYDPVGPAPGPHDISEDPVFVNPGFGNYHLRSTSPCIDRGTDVGIADDIDGDVRPQGEGFDMGADEVLPGGGGGWEAASVIGIEDNQASKAVNHLLFLFAPISVSLLWKRKRRTK